MAYAYKGKPCTLVCTFSSFRSLETEIKQEDGVFLHHLDDRQLLNLDIVSLTLVEKSCTF